MESKHAYSSNESIPALIPFRKGFFWQFCDRDKNIISSQKYIGATNFENGIAWANLNSKWGTISSDFEQLAPFEYSEFDDFREGLAPVRKYRGYYGFIDSLGDEVIPCKYEAVDSFHENLAFVEKDDSSAFIDKSGNEIIDLSAFRLSPRHSFERPVSNFHNGLSNVFIDYKTGFINQVGEIVIPCDFQLAGDFFDDTTWVLSNNKYGFIDKLGNKIVPCKYQAAGNFSEGLAAVVLNDKLGFIDKQGNCIIPFIFDRYVSNMPKFSEGLASVCLNGKWGYIDRFGNTVIPFVFDMAFDFSGGVARVTTVDYEQFKKYPCWYDNSTIIFEISKYGFIDKDGKQVVECLYNRARDFSSGLARVDVYDGYKIGYSSRLPRVDFFNNTKGYIDKFGRQYWEK